GPVRPRLREDLRPAPDPAPLRERRKGSGQVRARGDAAPLRPVRRASSPARRPPRQVRLGGGRPLATYPYPPTWRRPPTGSAGDVLLGQVGTSSPLPEPPSCRGRRGAFGAALRDWSRLLVKPGRSTHMLGKAVAYGDPGI